MSVDRVFILVDVSGSVIKSGSFNFAIGATDELLSAIPENIHVVVVPFAEEFETIEQRKLVAPALQRLVSLTDRSPGKKTRLYDTLVAVTRAQKLTMNDAIVVISDFDDDISKADRDTAEKTLRSHGARPALIMLPNQIQEPSEVEAWFNDAQRFSKNTAGFYVSLPRAQLKGKAILPPIFYQQALAFYRLTLPAGSITKNHLTVTVLDSSGKKMRNLEVRTSDAFQDCR